MTSGTELPEAIESKPESQEGSEPARSLDEVTFEPEASIEIEMEIATAEVVETAFVEAVDATREIGTESSSDMTEPLSQDGESEASLEPSAQVIDEQEMERYFEQERTNLQEKAEAMAAGQPEGGTTDEPELRTAQEKAEPISADSEGGSPSSDGEGDTPGRFSEMSQPPLGADSEVGSAAAADNPMVSGGGSPSGSGFEDERGGSVTAEEESDEDPIRVANVESGAPELSPESESLISGLMPDQSDPFEGVAGTVGQGGEISGSSSADLQGEEPGEPIPAGEELSGGGTQDLKQMLSPFKDNLGTLSQIVADGVEGGQLSDQAVTVSMSDGQLTIGAPGEDFESGFSAEDLLGAFTNLEAADPGDTPENLAGSGAESEGGDQAAANETAENLLANLEETVAVLQEDVEELQDFIQQNENNEFENITYHLPGQDEDGQYNLQEITLPMNNSIAANTLAQIQMQVTQILAQINVLEQELAEGDSDGVSEVTVQRTFIRH